MSFDGAAQIKFPQIGKVCLEDDVEIGANTTIDRGSWRDPDRAGDEDRQPRADRSQRAIGRGSSSPRRPGSPGAP